MARIVAIEHLTLDGVYQAPARADEDIRNGFEHGGWGNPGSDPKMQEVIG
ncbi:MAG: dihydrofolate reductase, partial [Mesorhizobium sp.]